jgi:hypothetical protein
MDSESESKVELEEQEKKSNAFLIGLALNLGRATRTAKAGLDAIGASAYKVGSGVKGRTRRLGSSAEPEKEEALPLEEGDDSKPKKKKKDKKKKE